MSNLSDFQLVDVKTLSSILNLSPSAIRYHVRCGRITPVKTLGRRVLFDLELVRQEILHGSSLKIAKGLPARHDQGSIFENRVDEGGFSERRKRK